MIIGKLHYDEDAVENGHRIGHNGHRIFPNYINVQRTLEGLKEISYGLLYPARLRITHQNEDKKFVDHQKDMDYVYPCICHKNSKNCL